MSTFTIIAIPQLVLACAMLALATTQKQRAFWIVGGVFTVSGMVNAIIGISLT
ncbi:hypothetical protein [Nissabacter sp. SGAir0207]|uniref:hypothetical protein n=1 Tax=Nissabacter sp. SGAir0207 TaxID=2126321 RepID=UPI00143CDB1C|nr:hypothetical protein [Nissabacter sp. SGAir0207]